MRKQIIYSLLLWSSLGYSVPSIICKGIQKKNEYRKAEVVTGSPYKVMVPDYIGIVSEKSHEPTYLNALRVKDTIYITFPEY